MCQTACRASVYLTPSLAALGSLPLQPGLTSEGEVKQGQSLVLDALKGCPPLSREEEGT